MWKFYCMNVKLFHYGMFDEWVLKSKTMQVDSVTRVNDWVTIIYRMIQNMYNFRNTFIKLMDKLTKLHSFKYKKKVKYIL